MTYIIGAFVLEFDAWAIKHTSDEMNLKDKRLLSCEIEGCFKRNGVPQKADGIYEGGAPKIIIITNEAVLSREMAMRKKFKYGKRARRTQKELFDPYKDELPFLKNPLFITIKDPYEVDVPPEL